MLAEWDAKNADFKRMVLSLPEGARVGAVVSAMPFIAAAVKRAQSKRGGAPEPLVTTLERPSSNAFAGNYSVRRAKPRIEGGSGGRRGGAATATPVPGVQVAPFASTGQEAEKRRLRKRTKMNGATGELKRKLGETKMEEQANGNMPMMGEEVQAGPGKCY